MERHNCCLNTKAIIDYAVSRNHPPEELIVGLEEELKGIPDPLAFLSDPHNWVSSEVCRVMYENIRRMTGEKNVAYYIGFESVTNKRLGYIQEIFVRAIATPRGAVRRVPTINDKFNRNKKVELVKVGRSSAIVRLYWNTELNLNSDFCAMNKGIYSAMFTIWGQPPGHIIETKCQFKGDPYCEFDLSWENPSLRSRLRMLVSKRSQLLTETLSELEREKLLLESKFSEVKNLNVRLSQKVDQLFSIQQASSVILSELDFDRLIPEVLRIFVKEIGYSRGMIMLLDPKEQILRFAEGVGDNFAELSLLKGYEIPLSRTHNILVKVVQSGQPIITDDASVLNLNPNNLIIRNYKPQSIIILPLMSRGRVIGVLAADHSSQTRAKPKVDEHFLQGFGNQVALAIENARMYKELRESYLISIQALVQALEAKDPYTRGHSERVMSYSVQLAKRMELSEELVEHITNMCLVHDIGKIGISEQILNKDGKLTESEFEHIRDHPKIGHKIIEPLDLNQDAVAVVRHHHEHYDGTGYPDGLAGEDIPLHVRIASVCDSFDAMTSDRSYRAALSINEAIMRLHAAAGTQFDPDIVAEFIAMIKSGELKGIMEHKKPATMVA